MKKTYILIDTYNLIFRSRHTTRGDVDMQIGMSFHIMFNSLRKMWRKFDGHHVVFCMEGRSWRKDVYKKYKLNRKVERAKKTQAELEDDKIFLEAMQEFEDFLKHKTNSTVLQQSQCEADDLIAFWVDAHPDDDNIIISSDSDYIQLLDRGNVAIYNGVTGVLMKQDGLYDDKDRKLEFTIKSDSKIKVGKPNPNFEPDKDWYDYAMFLKMIRGDKSDNIFPAYPGARVKGSRKTIGISDAFSDRQNRGYLWNNFMLQLWVDEEENEHRVKDKYEENKMLIDLTKQPDDVKQKGYQTILEAQEAKKMPNVGINFLKFCGHWDLKRLSDYPDDYAKILNASYN